jgi:phage shock protein C
MFITTNDQKKYQRSKSNKFIAGVCGGLGNYTSIDPIIWRAIFLFLPGTLSVYLFFWIFSKQDN